MGIWSQSALTRELQASAFIKNESAEKSWREHMEGLWALNEENEWVSSEWRLKRGYALERPASEMCGGSEVYTLDW